MGSSSFSAIFQTLLFNQSIDQVNCVFRLALRLKEWSVFLDASFNLPEKKNDGALTYLMTYLLKCQRSACWCASLNTTRVNSCVPPWIWNLLLKRALLAVITTTLLFVLRKTLKSGVLSLSFFKRSWLKTLVKVFRLTNHSALISESERMRLTCASFSTSL